MERTKKFFFRKKRLPGTICFFFGAFLVIWGWPFFGIIIELIGFVNLFKYEMNIHTYLLSVKHICLLI